MTTLRLWLVFTLFFRSQFDFTGYWVLRSTSLKSMFTLQGGSSWSLWADWLLPAIVAYAFILVADIRERMSGARAGLTMATIGIAVALGLGVWISVQMPSGISSSNGWLAIFALAGASAQAAPFLILAQLLLVLGVLRILFNLDPKPEQGPYGVRVPGRARPLPEARVQNPPPARAMEERPVAAVAIESTMLRSAPPPNRMPAEEIADVRAQLSANPADPRLHNHLHRLLAADANRQQEMLEHARDYLAALVNQSRGPQAYSLLVACVNRDAQFKPDADQIVALARLALAQNDPRTALTIMNKFVTLNPEHPQIPDVYYLSARACRDSKKFEQAVKLLNVLIERYPSSTVIRDAKALQQALQGRVPAG